MKYTAICLFFAFMQIACHGQIISLVPITPLPSLAWESSGIEVNNPSNIWTHNDSGDSARIYNIDTTGNILRVICLQVDTAKDCEESTQDSIGNYYIGDFGNNNNDRTDLRIYKIPNPDSIASDTITPQIIRFHFPDQHMFPPPSNEQNFDCEAMFHFHDSLYLFSKNRGTSSYCKMYRLPDQEGDYTAELIDSFDTGTWVTAADISPDGTRMALLSETNIWLFTDIEGSNFFGGNQQQIQMYITQKKP